MPLHTKSLGDIANDYVGIFRPQVDENAYMTAVPVFWATSVASSTRLHQIFKMEREEAHWPYVTRSLHPKQRDEFKRLWVDDARSIEAVMENATVLGYLDWSNPEAAVFARNVGLQRETVDEAELDRACRLYGMVKKVEGQHVKLYHEVCGRLAARYEQLAKGQYRRVPTSAGAEYS